MSRQTQARLPESMVGCATVQFAHENYLALGALVQLARLLITKPHEAAQRPLTTALVLLYGAVGAAVSTGRLSVESLRLDESLLATEPSPVYIHPKSCVQYVLLKGVEGA